MFIGITKLIQIKCIVLAEIDIIKMQSWRIYRLNTVKDEKEKERRQYQREVVLNLNRARCICMGQFLSQNMQISMLNIDL